MRKVRRRVEIGGRSASAITAAVTNSLFLFFIYFFFRNTRVRGGSCIKYYVYSPMYKILSVYNSSTVTPISSYLFVRQGERERERHYLLHFHRGRKLIVARYICACIYTTAARHAARWIMQRALRKFPSSAIFLGE